MDLFVSTNKSCLYGFVSNGQFKREEITHEPGSDNFKMDSTQRFKNSVLALVRKYLQTPVAKEIMSGVLPSGKDIAFQINLLRVFLYAVGAPYETKRKKDKATATNFVPRNLFGFDPTFFPKSWLVLLFLSPICKQLGLGLEPLNMFSAKDTPITTASKGESRMDDRSPKTSGNELRKGKQERIEQQLKKKEDAVV